ncbi:hypothetical protein BGW39_002125, partial [Mortierella sp. 14UC]
DLFQEVVIVPFSKDQVMNYVERYAIDPQAALLFNNNQAPWSAEYMDKLAIIPSVMDLVNNPFLLTLALKALPGLAASNKDLSSIRVMRAGFYDMFVDQWLETNKDKSTWKSAFFDTDPEDKLLRDASPFVRTGTQYRFVHRSILEHLLSRIIYNPAKIDKEFVPQAETIPRASLLLDTDNPLFQRVLLKEPSVIQFLSDRVKSSQDFERQLRSVVNLSKADIGATIAATNAITILVRADVSFNGADLRGIKAPGVDLSNGQFDSAQFQGADWTGVNLSASWLRQADMRDVHMEGVRFGELPYFDMDGTVLSCHYSPDGKMLGVALYDGVIDIYNTTTWTRMHRLEKHAVMVKSIAFSKVSQRLVSGNCHKTVRLWDTTSGEELLVMVGHSDYVFSVAISPCGGRIASAGDDETVRLWDAQTGESLFVLQGHESCVRSVKYSPDGRQLVSVSSDETIRLWNPETGAPGAVLELLLGEVISLSFSPDGRWVAAGHNGGHLQLWNAVLSQHYKN